MAVTQADILGKGWSFPFRFSSVGRVRKVVGVTPADSIEKVKMAMRQILGTRLGSRVIDRDWGSDLRNIIFEPINQVTVTRVRFAVSEALERWERRIEILAVSVNVAQAADGIIETDVDFRVSATQELGNLVYPFYITPDMRVQGQILVG
jgi:phage baseplate assembly protein W